MDNLLTWFLYLFRHTHSHNGGFPGVSLVCNYNAGVVCGCRVRCLWWQGTRTLNCLQISVPSAPPLPILSSKTSLEHVGTHPIQVAGLIARKERTGPASSLQSAGCPSNSARCWLTGWLSIPFRRVSYCAHSNTSRLCLQILLHYYFAHLSFIFDSL